MPAKSVTSFVFPFCGARRLAVACVLGAAVLGGCALYRPEIIQGNFVSKEQVAQLQPGMPRAVVVQVLGSPLLVDMFRDNRWDYVFSIRDRAGVQPQEYSLTVFFEGDALARVEGADNLPSEADFVKEIGGTKVYKPRKLQADPQRLARFAEQNKPAQSTGTAPAAPAATSYPALPQ